MTINEQVKGRAAEEYANFIVAADAAGAVAVSEWFDQQLGANWFDRQLAEITRQEY